MSPIRGVVSRWVRGAAKYTSGEPPKPVATIHAPRALIFGASTTNGLPGRWAKGRMAPVSASPTRDVVQPRRNQFDPFVVYRVHVSLPIRWHNRPTAAVQEQPCFLGSLMVAMSVDVVSQELRLGWRSWTP